MSCLQLVHQIFQPALSVYKMRSELDNALQTNHSYDITKLGCRLHPHFIDNLTLLFYLCHVTK